MTFGGAFKAKINSQEIIISFIDSKLTISNNNNNFNVKNLEFNGQKLKYRPNKNLSYIQFGEYSNMDVIFDLNNFKDFKKNILNWK